MKYSLYYREEAGTYQDLTSSIGALDTSYTITGLSVGINYEFVVNCENIYGKSQNSTSSLIKCATNPDPSTSLGTSYDDTNVIFSWANPSGGENGETITSHTIFIKNKDSDFVEATSKCSPLTTTTCAIEMSLLWVSPFTLSITGTDIPTSFLIIFSYICKNFNIEYLMGYFRINI